MTRHSPDAAASIEARHAPLQELGRSANRVCMLAADNPAHCLKYRLPGAKLDANRIEWKAWQWLRQRVGADELQDRFARVIGPERTVHGEALRCAVIRDRDGGIARSLYVHLYDADFATPHSAAALCVAVADFERFLLQRKLPLFDLNAGNFVVVDEGDGPRLVCVDAKSLCVSKEILPLSRWIAPLGKRKLRRRAARLRARIGSALAPRAAST